MAALRAEIESDSRGGTIAHRLAHKRVSVSAHTWRTFVSTELNADGTGLVTVKRDEVTLMTYRIEQPEIEVRA